MSCQRQSGTGLFKILQRKFRPEKMTLFFYYLLAPKGSHKKCPTDLKFVALLLNAVLCQFRSTHFCTNCVYKVFFKVISARNVVLQTFRDWVEKDCLRDVFYVEKCR